MNGRLELIPDPKKEIKFWIEILSKPNLDEKSTALVNEGLQKALICYLNPIYSYEIKS